MTVDCTDPDRVARFWAEALGWELRDHRVEPPDGGPYLEFIRVPEGKTVKNRLHLGLSVRDLDAETERLVGLGATVAWEEEFPRAGRTATSSCAMWRATSSVWATSAQD